MNPFFSFPNHWTRIQRWAWRFKRGIGMLMHYGFKAHKRRLMVARLGGIGDYVLFRNFLPALSTAFEGEIILVGNDVFKDFATHFDQQYIQQFIWINAQQYQKNWQYRLRIWWQLGRTRSDIHLTSDHSHGMQSIEIAVVSGAKFRIAPRIMAISELNYGYHYCPIPLDATQHEFERNRFFIQTVLDFWGQGNIPLPQKTMLNELKYLKKNLNTITLFLGASDKTRCWAAQHWADLITQLASIHPFAFVLLGGKSELETAEQIIEKINLKINLDIIVQNIVNQTTLPDLAIRIAQSQLLVSNDSGAAHIAVAVETPCVCISNGNHYGRFVPYATHLATHFKVILPPSLQGIEAAILSEKFSMRSDVDIQNIEPIEVTNAVFNYLNLNVSDKNA